MTIGRRATPRASPGRAGWVRRAAVVPLLVAPWLALAGGSAAAETPVPHLELAPNPVTGAPWVTAFGRHFCGESDCSSVTITVSGDVVATDVPVAGDGTFQREFRVTTPPGHHRVEATQTDADGEVILAAETLAVPARDFAVSTSPQETHAPHADPQEAPAPSVDPDDRPTTAGDEGPVAPTPTDGSSGSPAAPTPSVAPTPAVGGPLAAEGRAEVPAGWWVAGLLVVAAALLGGAWWRRRTARS